MCKTFRRNTCKNTTIDYCCHKCTIVTFSGLYDESHHIVVSLMYIHHHPSLLTSIPIVHMGIIHPYCTHGDYPSLLYTWGPSILIVHMGTIHPYCTHGDHPSLLYMWGPCIPILWVGHRTLEMVGPLLPYLLPPSLPLLAPSPTTSSCQAFGYDDICISV